MRLGPTRFAVRLLACALLAGCLGHPARELPGPTPIPEAWSPRQELRARFRVSLPTASDGGSGALVLDPRDGLSPDEAGLMALDQNPTLRALRDRRGLAQAELLAAGVLPNPRLALSLAAPTSGADANELGYGAGLSWNVSPLLARAARRRAAREGRARVDLEIAWQEWQVLQAARLHSLRLIDLDARIELAHQAAEAWRPRVEALRSAQQGALVSEVELSRAELSWAHARQAAQRLEQERLVEQAALAEALGRDLDALPRMQAESADLAPPPALSTLLSELPERRLDLLALQHAARSHDAGRRVETLRRFPAIEVGAQLGRGVDGVGSAGATLSFGIPLFDRNQGGPEREAESRHEVEDEYAARLMRARVEVAREWRELNLIEEQLAVARQAEGAAQRLADAMRGAADTGSVAVLATLDAEDVVLTARLRRLRLEARLRETRLALSLSSGRFF